MYIYIYKYSESKYRSRKANHYILGKDVDPYYELSLRRLKDIWLLSW